MGRFVHEATCTDPSTGITYLTEDATPSGLYRYVPTTPGRLADGGELQMLAIGSTSHQTYRAGTGTTYRNLTWVTIDQPDPGAGETSVVQQGIAKGGAQFARLEGAWYGDESVYFHATSGGDAGFGQVWRYRPGEAAPTATWPSPSSIDARTSISSSRSGGCSFRRAIRAARSLLPVAGSGPAVRSLRAPRPCRW